MTLATILQQRPATEIVSVAPDALVHDVIEMFEARRIGAVPVVENDVVVGIMSERDVIGALARDGAAMLDWPVERVMTRPPVTATPDMTLLAALSLMTRRRFRHLPVLDGQAMVGFVSIGDLVKARIDRIEQEADAMRAYIAG
ncbi:CBS domain-containing protein [Sphingomonas nostoxanthinifaciens]|uniref:CBS domain-containing protein n=1 Tax=Sphingomonas nostoxanthinifaciens TaxID=2872652 RepID=UPI001CC21D44|nr:CBS domain-containing protein [Sphingomonas nostoxanthinifaciens]UAK24067.1 CBS domain-containing protein [Sphingomonas nostoxanthinifaciens]